MRRKDKLNRLKPEGNRGNRYRVIGTREQFTEYTKKPRMAGLNLVIVLRYYYV